MNGSETGQRPIPVKDYILRIYFVDIEKYSDGNIPHPIEKEFITEKDWEIFSKDLQTLFNTFPNINVGDIIGDRSGEVYEIVEKSFKMVGDDITLEIWLL